ncbi:hypothetical protein A2U01_0114464, partial [Trifolium medium]|nr:hypothetical protein [Trifolium medium]
MVILGLRNSWGYNHEYYEANKSYGAGIN